MSSPPELTSLFTTTVLRSDSGIAAVVLLRCSAISSQFMRAYRLLLSFYDAAFDMAKFKSAHSGCNLKHGASVGHSRSTVLSMAYEDFRWIQPSVYSPQ